MTKRELSRWAIGSSMAVALCASTLPAQVDTTRRDTTRTARSTTRIPIRKSGGDVVLPSTRARADSIAQARRDTMRRADLARNDSIVAAERIRTDSVNMSVRPDSSALAARGDSIVRGEQFRTDSISRSERARNDSIARVNPAITPPINAVVTPPTNPVTPTTTPVVTPTPVETQAMPASQGRRLPGSFYMGLAAGSASPTTDLQDLGYDSGLSISVPIGWHNPAALFGWRLMLGYSQFNGASFTTGGTNPVVLSNSDPKVYSAELNLNMRFPFNERKTSSVYFTGGGGVYLFRNFGQASALGGYLGNDVLDPDDSANESTINKWGVNGGAGLEFGIGTSSLFLETRLVNVFAGRDDEPNFDSVFGERGSSLRWFPLVLGFTIR